MLTVVAGYNVTTTRGARAVMEGLPEEKGSGRSKEAFVGLHRISRASSRYESASRGRGVTAVLLVALLAMSLVLPFPAAAVPKTLWVDDGGSNANPGTETAPFKTITHAMSQAGSGDSIRVKSGTYDGALGETFPIVVKPGVRLLSVSGPQVTIIDGSPSRVIEMEDSTAGTVLLGFTLQSGSAAQGAAILVSRTVAGPVGSSGWPLIQRNIIRGNGAAGCIGAGISVTATGGTADPLIDDNVIEQNSGLAGGAIACLVRSAPTIRDNVFRDNTVSAAGGGIYVGADSDPTMVGNTFDGNTAAGGGGAIYTALSAGIDVLAQECRFVGNSSGGTSDGGAVLAQAGVGATLRFERCDFTDNTSGDDGGAVQIEDGTAIITNSVMWANHATLPGGVGGALRVTGGTVQVTNCTIWGNDPSINGVSAVVGDLDLKNCIVGGHSGDDIYGLGVSYSLVEDTVYTGVSEGDGVIHGDPRFRGTWNVDFQTLANSPCIDSGTNTGAPALDILGVTRPLDGDGDGSAVADMGAYEQPVPKVIRHAGSDRYETACSIARANIDKDDSDTVIVASGEGFADALSAAGLAGAYDAPLLLVRKDSIPGSVKSTMDYFGADNVIVVGGPAVIADEVMTQLPGGRKQRIWGNNRYATSAQVARAIPAAEHGTDIPVTAIDTVFIARGDAFPDALAAAPFAYSTESPILLTEPGSLPGPVESVLKDFDVADAFVCGGTSAVSTMVAGRIDTLIKPGNYGGLERWSGTDRYATAAAIADGAYDQELHSWSYIGTATGENFPDALAGGAAAGAQQGCVLLVRGDLLPSVTAQRLAANKNMVQYAQIYGGTSAVRDSVMAGVANALDW